MSCNLDPAIKYWGSIKKIAEVMDVETMTIYTWRIKDDLPIKRALQMVELSNGKVKLRDLMPHLKGVR